MTHISSTIECESELLDDVKSFVSSKSDMKQRGVVFTNEKTILTLLDLLPNHVWTNPNYKWLDPSAGIGNFMIYVFFKLMNHLPIENTDDRRKHILETMLHFVEIKTDYVDTIHHIFCGDRYQLNIHEGSFVEMNIDSDNQCIYTQDISFDIIVTNPPYQKPTKQGGASAKPLYHLFIHKSLQKLSPKGYLVAIHPFTWRRKSKEIKLMDDLLQYQIHTIYTNNNYTEFDKSAIHINYYLLQKISPTKTTLCKNYFNHTYYESRLKLTNRYGFLPILLTKETMSIIHKVCGPPESKLTIQHQSKIGSTHSPSNTSTTQCDMFLYPNYHTYSLKKQTIIYRYTKQKHPSHDKHKIIMNFKGGYKLFRPFVDKGTMGITDCGLYIDLTEQNETLILNLLTSPLFMFLLMITSYNYAPNMKNEFHVLNTISVQPQYKLTKHEQSFLNTVISIK